MKKYTKNFLKGLGILLFYLISSLFSNIFLTIFSVDYNSMPIIFKIIYNLSYEILITAIILLVYNDIIKKCFKKFIKNNKEYFNEYIKYWFLALGLIIISNMIITLICGSTTSTNQEEVLYMFSKAPIYTFIITVIIAPILEELVFRLSIRKMISKTNWLFILMSGLLFGCMHVVGNTTIYEYLYIIPYSIPGWIFAYTLVKSNNIFVPISLHFIHNGILMSLQILLMLI